MNPVKISIMDVNEFVSKNNCLPVTSGFIKDATTGKFDDNGLFSERIFGELGTVNRLSQHGYIELNTTILNSDVFRMLCDLGTHYEAIMAGTLYAKFDSTLKDFVKVSSIDRDAETGYAFFMRYVTKLRFTPNESTSHNERIQALMNNKDNWTIQRHLVIPAGLREYREKDGRGESDAINVFYRRMVDVSTTLNGVDTENSIFDNVRYNLQRCANDVNNYLWEFMQGKTGFIQDKFAARSVARATRNVLVSADVSSADDNPEAAVHPDEVMVPLIQAMAAAMPVFKYTLKTLFFNNVFSQESDQAALIDPKTYALSYVVLTTKERSRYIASDKLESMISMFKDDELRHSPVTVIGADNNYYYLYLIYRKGNDIYLGRSYEELKNILVEQGIVMELKKEDLRPITYYEMYYLACYQACRGKHITVTRYPITSDKSIFPSKINLATTTSYDKIVLRMASNLQMGIALPRWPVLGASSINGLSMHPSQLKNVNADFDGDMGNSSIILSEEANKECDDYLNHPRFVVDPSGSLNLSLSTGLAKVTMYNLTRSRN